MRISVLPVWLVATTACTSVQLTAQPTTLVAHAADLATTGHADVEVDQGGTARVFRDDVIAITLPGNQRSHLWGLIKTGTPDRTDAQTIGNLLAPCGAGPGPGCALAHVVDPIVVGERKHVDAARVGVAVFGAATATVSLICLAVCHPSSDWEFVGAGLGVVTLIVPLATARF